MREKHCVSSFGVSESHFGQKIYETVLTILLWDVLGDHSNIVVDWCPRETCCPRLWHCGSHAKPI